MTETTLPRTGTGAALQRHIGTHAGEGPGPLVLCVAGIHGNEGASIPAARRVLQSLAARQPRFRGRFVVLAGNLAALAQNRRYLVQDLNRAWLPEAVAALAAGEASVPGAGSEAAGEHLEQRQLWAALECEMGGSNRPVYFLDLHTSSAPGPPFTTVGDTLRNRRFARSLGLPMVLGLEEQVDGALLEHINNLGHVTVGVEAGQHQAPEAVDHHEAVLWLALAAAGCLTEADLPDAAASRRLLAAAAPGAPAIVEVRHRHVVRPGDGFVMGPGFRNFAAVAAGDEVARDAAGPVGVAESCRLLLPLYQAQGDDGFFTVREVRAIWLHLSSLLRRLGVPGLVAWLPGVRPHPRRPGTLLVNTRVARLFPLQVFHLLGFRKRRWDGHLLQVSRRRFDPS